MQPFQNIASRERFIDVETSNGGITKVSPSFLFQDSMGGGNSVKNIVDPNIKAFYQDDNILQNFIELEKNFNPDANSTDISNTNKLGASDTDVKNLPSNLGTLALFPQAAQFAETLVPKTATISPEEQAFLFFTKMAAEASKPGATAIGAAGEAGQDLVKTRIAQKALDSKRAGDVASVASSIFSAIKPKVGKPSTIKVGVAEDAGGNPKFNANGKQIFKFQVYEADGTAKGDPFEATEGTASTTVNLGDKEWDKMVVGGIEAFYVGSGSGENAKPGVLDKEEEAMTQISKLDLMLDLLQNPTLKTGVLQDKMNVITQIFDRIGVRNMSDKEIENIALAQSFNSLSSQMVLASVQQMKGALSDKELGFLQGIQPSLQNTKEGNRLLVLMAKHALQKDIGFNEFFEDFKERNKIDPNATWSTMGTDSASDKRLASRLQKEYTDRKIKPRKNLFEFIKGEADKYSKELQDRNPDINRDQLTAALEQRFKLSIMKKAFEDNF